MSCGCGGQLGIVTYEACPGAYVAKECLVANPAGWCHMSYLVLSFKAVGTWGATQPCLLNPEALHPQRSPHAAVQT